MLVVLQAKSMPSVLQLYAIWTKLYYTESVISLQKLVFISLSAAVFSALSMKLENRIIFSPGPEYCFVVPDSSSFCILFH